MRPTQARSTAAALPPSCTGRSIVAQPAPGQYDGWLAPPERQVEENQECRRGNARTASHRPDPLTARWHGHLDSWSIVGRCPARPGPQIPFQLYAVRGRPAVTSRPQHEHRGSRRRASTSSRLSDLRQIAHQFLHICWRLLSPAVATAPRRQISNALDAAAAGTDRRKLAQRKYPDQHPAPADRAGAASARAKVGGLPVAIPSVS